MNHQAGFAVFGPMTLPFPPANDNETVTLAMIDGDLVFTHPEAQQPLVMEWADEPPWEFNEQAKADGIPDPMLTSTDIELVMGCPNEQAARLIGRTTATLDGTTMDFTYRLIIVGRDAMFGVMHVHSIMSGQTMNAWRTVAITR